MSELPENTVRTGEIADLLDLAVFAAKKAGKHLLGRLGKANSREKGPGDWVTEADLESQSLIFEEIRRRFPSHALMGEEADASEVPWKRGWCWIVDPIDGTKNFIHRLPSFSVSIGLFLDGRPLVGVVYDPLMDELFSAVRGEGAWLNGDPIQPSGCESLERSLLVSSFPARVGPQSPELRRFNKVVQRASMRRLGSAALNLCYVACGRLDGYWASTLSLWDIAAGMLVAEEAGVAITGLDGGPFDYSSTCFSATATGSLGQQLLPLLQVNDEA